MAFGDLTAHNRVYTQANNFALDLLNNQFKINLSNAGMTVPVGKQDNNDVAGVIDREHRPDGDFRTLG